MEDCFLESATSSSNEQSGEMVFRHRPMSHVFAIFSMFYSSGIAQFYWERLMYMNETELKQELTTTAKRLAEIRGSL